MLGKYELKSGQINYENKSSRGSYHCVVIKDGVFHNLTEETRQDLISKLQNPAPKQETIDIDDMF